MRGTQFCWQLYHATVRLALAWLSYGLDTTSTVQFYQQLCTK